MRNGLLLRTISLSKSRGIWEKNNISNYRSHHYSGQSSRTNDSWSRMLLYRCNKTEMRWNKKGIIIRGFVNLVRCIISPHFMREKFLVVLCPPRPSYQNILATPLLEANHIKKTTKFYPNYFDNIVFMFNQHFLLRFAWVVDDAKCIVVTRVCVSVCLFAAACLHYCTDPDVTWGSGRECSLCTIGRICNRCTGCIAMATLEMRGSAQR